MGQQIIKASFPHIGEGWIAFKALLEGVGCQVICPPQITKKTITLGTKYSPEFVCFPFKVNVGNFIEACELGAEVLFMVGGSGRCRLGFYNVIQQRILKSLGYKFEMIVLNQNNLRDALFNKLRNVGDDNSYKKVIRAFRLFWHKARLIAKIEKLTRQKAAYEIDKGKAYETKQKNLKMLDDVKNLDQLQQTEIFIEDAFRQIKIDKNIKKPKVAITGEVYVTLESAVNFNIEKQLIELGTEVEQKMSIYRWLKVLFKIDLERLYNKYVARPYLKYSTAGEDQQSIATLLRAKQKGYDGVILLYPFTCMPENIAKGIMAKISKDMQIPFLAFSLDEHSSEVGIRTRLEAFVDMLYKKNYKYASYC